MQETIGIDRDKKSRMFAKLYEAEAGQILVKIDSSPEEIKPEVRFYFYPPGLGVCSIALSFEDSDDGWGKAEKLFHDVDEATAFNLVEESMKGVESFGNAGT